MNALAPGGILRWSSLALLLVLQCPSHLLANDAAVEMAASAKSFTFSPDKIIAHVGQLETIKVKSSEGIHGIASPEFGIDTTLVRPDHPVTLTFTPKSPGEYVVHCAIVCGIGHKGMAFTISVLP